VEPDVESRLRASPLRVLPLRSVDGRTVLANDASGRCLFLEPNGLCAVHRQLGHDALPVSCRMFPRVCLLTPRGVSISLSHYCPTAAALLFEPAAPFAIVDDAPAFPPSRPYEGLDARAAAPPLLRPGVWLGWDGHERWERHAVEVLGRDVTPEAALALLAAQAEAARAWSVDRGPFASHLGAVLADDRPQPIAPPSDDALVEDVLASVPAALRPTPAPAGEVEWSSFALPLRRYLASRAFASWAGVQGAGLRTWVRSLQAALAVARREAARATRPLDTPLHREAVRRTDLLLVHLASPERLAARLSRSEGVRSCIRARTPR
jgi:hypothetical protein